MHGVEDDGCVIADVLVLWEVETPICGVDRYLDQSIEGRGFNGFRGLMAPHPPQAVNMVVGSGMSGAWLFERPCGVHDRRRERDWEGAAHGLWYDELLWRFRDA